MKIFCFKCWKFISYNLDRPLNRLTFTTFLPWQSVEICPCALVTAQAVRGSNRQIYVSLKVTWNDNCGQAQPSRDPPTMHPSFSPASFPKKFGPSLVDSGSREASLSCRTRAPASGCPALPLAARATSGSRLSCSCLLNVSCSSAPWESCLPCISTTATHRQKLHAFADLCHGRSVAKVSQLRCPSEW